MSGIGGYMPRKDRKYLPILHYRNELPLGTLRHIILPSGMVITWRDEYPVPQSSCSPLPFLPFTDEET